jgi:HK97 family phage major capsid protein
LALTERSSPVRKISVWLPVTQEQLEDVEGIQSYINQRLTFMCRQRLDSQVINGNGSAPNLSGILITSGVQTFARGAGDNPTDQFDSLYRARKNIMVTGRANPSAYIIHPNDWEEMRLMRSNDGIYILGNPTEPGPARIWGLTVVEADVIPENTALCGDFPNFSQLFEKRGIEVDITDSHSDYFVYGKLAVRASFRVALPIYRPSAFCSITQF